jgi:hypothetical protein
LIRLGAFADAGFDECILGLAPPYGDRSVTVLERFAAEIAPRFASGGRVS